MSDVSESQPVTNILKCVRFNHSDGNVLIYTYYSDNSLGIRYPFCQMESWVHKKYIREMINFLDYDVYKTNLLVKLRYSTGAIRMGYLSVSEIKSDVILKEVKAWFRLENCRYICSYKKFSGQEAIDKLIEDFQSRRYYKKPLKLRISI